MNEDTLFTTQLYSAQHMLRIILVIWRWRIIDIDIRDQLVFLVTNFNFVAFNDYRCDIKM